MREAILLYDTDGRRIHLHAPSDATSVYVPSSIELWDIIWQRGNRFGGFAHTHPGCALPSPSEEDTSTFAAIEAACGRNLFWWIFATDSGRGTCWRRGLDERYRLSTSDPFPYGVCDLLRASKGLSYCEIKEVRHD